MSKLLYALLATAMVLSSASVMAASSDANPTGISAKAEYEYNMVDGNNANANQANVTFAKKLNPYLAADVKGEFSRTDSSGALGDRLEVGLSTRYDILTLRGAVGEKFSNGENHSYFLIEPGVKFQLDQDLSLIARYRYRDTFSNNYNEETHRVKFGAEYNLTKNTVVDASFARSFGDTQYNTIAVGYSVNF